MIEYSELKKFVRRRIPGSLYNHCVATGRLAFELAVHHGMDSQKACVAGLLHDIARAFDDDELTDKAQQYGLDVSDLERSAPVLLHGAVGAVMAESELGITDPDTLEAIRVHTTGAPGMGAIARVVFVADYAEPTRSMREVRELLPERLDQAVLAVAKCKIDYVIGSGKPIHPLSIELRSELTGKPAARTERP